MSELVVDGRGPARAGALVGHVLGWTVQTDDTNRAWP